MYSCLECYKPQFFITHGLGTDGIKYYQNSKYVDLIKESAQNLGHEVVCVSWLDADSPEKGFAGILPQERISRAVKIAKEILNKIKAGNKIILIVNWLSFCKTKKYIIIKNCFQDFKHFIESFTLYSCLSSKLSISQISNFGKFHFSSKMFLPKYPF